MAIYVPGIRGRHNRPSSGGKRSAVATLNMTAMVDMFTVLCVFLLQNYATTNQILQMPDKVDLPRAHETKELKPANVVIIANDGITMNNQRLVDLETVKSQKDWLIKPLAEMLQKTIADGDAKKSSLGNQVRAAVNQAKNKAAPAAETDDYRKITVQSDRKMDFLTVKKIMFTVTEAGMQEINFAVVTKPNDQAAN